jgi:Kef-type K+ transport system membrane component KefB
VNPETGIIVHLPILVRFAIVLAIFLIVPPLSRRLRMPPVVGLLLAGVALGPSGLHTLPHAAPVAEFFGEIGKLLLMFFAGLEIDLSQFRATARKSLAFGLLTFSFPFVFGASVGLLTGYHRLSAVLIGSLLASHTLLGLNIVRRMKLVTDEAVAVTIGGTVFTDFLSLLILAICLPIHRAGFSLSVFGLQLVEMAGYVLVILLGLGTFGHWLITRLSHSRESQVTLVLLLIATAGFVAEFIDLAPIIGAFLTGLAVNRTLAESEAKDQLEFLGNTLFIPMFFVSIGFLIDVRVFLHSLIDKPWLVGGIVGSLLVGKFIGAFFTRCVNGYTRNQEHLIWSLSLPQVAATLATALVAFDTRNAAGVRLIDEHVINAAIVLLVVTSILGPILTDTYARRRVRELAVAPPAEPIHANSPIA